MSNSLKRSAIGRRPCRRVCQWAFRCGFALLALLLCSVWLTATANATQIWIGATPPGWRQLKGWAAGNYMDFFKPGSRWGRVAGATQVFFLTQRFVLRSSDQELSSVIAGLKALHIAIAVQLVPLVPEPTCGRGVESYGYPADALNVARRIKRMGGVLAYARLDEPLWFGHAFISEHGRYGCRMPISKIAAEAARKINQVKTVFPAVQVGDGEPFGVPVPNQVWADELAQWFTAYQAAVGQPLAYFAADCAWVRPNWKDQFLLGVQVVHNAGIPLGVIYNASRREETDLSWANAAIAHYRLIEGQLGVRPDQAIFQTWTDRPRLVLPEDTPGTLTNIVLSYLSWEAAGR